MPVSQGSGGAGVPGTTLKAWAKVTAGGALVEGFNVASASKTGAGAYSINFATAMAAGAYYCRATASGASNADVNFLKLASSSTAGRADVLTGVPGVPLDIAAVWEFYQ